MKKLLLLCIFLILGFCIPVISAEQAGKDFPLLNTGLGARPSSMGGSFTAVANDCQSVYWNPAGMLLGKKFELSSMQVKLPSDINVYYLTTQFQSVPTANAKPTSAWGFYWLNSGMTNIPLVSGNETTVTNSVAPNLDVKPYDYSEYQSNILGASYAWWQNTNLAFGINAMGMYQIFDKMSQGKGAGASLSLGMLWLLDYQWTMGAVLRDMLNYQKWSTGAEEYVHPEARIGLAYTPIENWLISGEVKQKLDSRYAMTFHLGTECSFFNFLKFRGGFDEDRFTAGCGIYIGKINFNYAYIGNVSDGLGDNNRISFGIEL